MLLLNDLSPFNCSIKPSSFLCTQHCDCLTVWNTDYPFPFSGIWEITSQNYRSIYSFLSRHCDAKQGQIFLHLKLNVSSFHTPYLFQFILLVPLLHTSSSLKSVFHFCSIVHRLHSFTIFHFSSLTFCFCLGIVHIGYSFTHFGRQTYCLSNSIAVHFK